MATVNSIQVKDARRSCQRPTLRVSSRNTESCRTGCSSLTLTG
jgi:hypothetical protein